MKHTKGNWYASEGQIYPEETGKTLALIPYYDKDDKEQEANANLIAAAPDMLKALKKADDFFRDNYEQIELSFWREIQDAIQKATNP